MTGATGFFDMGAAPMRIGKVRLKVRDLDAVSAFYRDVLGLAVMAGDGREAVLGTGRTSLLALQADPALSPRDRRQAGLFHTAFLMPTRADLARWLGHAAATGVRLDGAADRFYRDVLGFDIAADYPGASFYGSGGYHHQLAGNIWNSRGAAQRPRNMAGLDAVEIVVRDAAGVAAIASRAEGAGIEASRTGEGVTLRDPWGTAITLAA